MIVWFLAGVALLALASYCGWNAIRSAREQHSRNTSFWIVASLLTTLLSFGILRTASWEAPGPRSVLRTQSQLRERSPKL